MLSSGTPRNEKPFGSLKQKYFIFTSIIWKIITDRFSVKRGVKRKAGKTSLRTTKVNNCEKNLKFTGGQPDTDSDRESSRSRGGFLCPRSSTFA